MASDIETAFAALQVAHTTAASQRFFATYELVLSTLHFVDELSLVRAQDVNYTFRNVIQENSALRQRIRFRHSGAKVVDTSCGGGTAADMCWNPLLNWFCFNSFHRSNHFEFGSLEKCGEYGMLTLLPHALRAARNPSSSVHEILATT
jgi:hypothetical protein